MHPTIRVYFDRIEFQNPGGFHLPLEKALTEIVSQPRNPILIRLFRFAKLGENAGYGIQRMKKWTELTGGAVDFKSDITHSTVTYWRTEKSGFEHNSTQESTTKTTTESTTELARHTNNKGDNGKKVREKTREKIREIIGENPKVTTDIMAGQIGVSPKTIEWHLANMKKDGEIKREGPDKGGHWVILK